MFGATLRPQCTRSQRPGAARTRDTHSGRCGVVLPQLIQHTVRAAGQRAGAGWHRVPVLSRATCRSNRVLGVATITCLYKLTLTTTAPCLPSLSHFSTHYNYHMSLYLDSLSDLSNLPLLPYLPTCSDLPHLLFIAKTPLQIP